jgi:hypothetical protein
MISNQAAIKRQFDFAAAFRFLHQPSRPSAPRPVANSESAGGVATEDRDRRYYSR